MGWLSSALLPLHSTQALVAGEWLYVFNPAAQSSNPLSFLFILSQLKKEVN